MSAEDIASAKPERLTLADAARLLVEPSDETRAMLAAKVARQCAEPAMTASERRLAEEIVRSLARDTAEAVRRALADSLKDSPNLPRDVALMLARDVESVALPFIEMAPVLSEADLIELLHHSSEARQVAVALRPNLPQPVGSLLAATGSERAVAVLIGNGSAALDAPSLKRALDRFPDSEAVATSVANRPRLPPTVREHLAAAVSDRVRDRLVREHGLSEEVAADLILDSRERTILSLASDEPGDAALQRLTAQLAAAGRLTSSLLVRAICTGDEAFLEAGLAALAEIPLANARLLLHDDGGLASLLAKANLPAPLAGIFRCALEVSRQTPLDGEPGDLERRRIQMIERILTQAANLDEGDIAYLLRRLGVAVA